MLRRLVICTAILIVLSMVTVLPICGLMFRCGCTMISGEKYCNIHQPRVPHCPWCEGGAKAFVPGYVVAMLTATGAVSLALRDPRRSIWIALLAGAAAYLACLAFG